MARIQVNPRAIASLLDRLTAEDPGTTHEAVPLGLHNVDQFRASVARDLEVLLNTKRGYLNDIPEHDSEVAGSLLMYGLPDFMSKSSKNQSDRTHVLQAIEEAIVRFEPRLRDVKVLDMSGLESSEDEGSKEKEKSQLARTMHFRVVGMLKVDPVPEPVAFDTVLHLSTQQYELKEKC